MAGWGLENEWDNRFTVGEPKPRPKLVAIKNSTACVPPQLCSLFPSDRSQQRWSLSNQRFLPQSFNPIPHLPISYIHSLHFGIWNTHSQFSTPVLIRFTSFLHYSPPPHSSQDCNRKIQPQNEAEAPGFPKAWQEKIIQRLLVDSVFCCRFALCVHSQQRESDWVHQARLSKGKDPFSFLSFSPNLGCICSGKCGVGLN